MGDDEDVGASFIHDLHKCGEHPFSEIAEALSMGERMTDHIALSRFELLRVAGLGLFGGQSLPKAGVDLAQASVRADSRSRFGGR